MTSTCVQCGREADGFAFCANADCISTAPAHSKESAVQVVQLPNATTYVR